MTVKTFNQCHFNCNGFWIKLLLLLISPYHVTYQLHPVDTVFPLQGPFFTLPFFSVAQQRLLLEGCCVCCWRDTDVTTVLRKHIITLLNFHPVPPAVSTHATPGVHGIRLCTYLAINCLWYNSAFEGLPII